MQLVPHRTRRFDHVFFGGLSFFRVATPALRFT